MLYLAGIRRGLLLPVSIFMLFVSTSLAQDANCDPQSQNCQGVHGDAQQESIDSSIERVDPVSGPSTNRATNLSSIRETVRVWLLGNTSLIIPLLISNSIILAPFLVVLIWRRRRARWASGSHRHRSFRYSGQRQEDRVLALLDKVDTDARQLQRAVDDISNILSHYPAPGSGQSRFPESMHSAVSSRSTKREIPESEAERILLRILDEFSKITPKLFRARDKAHYMGKVLVGLGDTDRLEDTIHDQGAKIRALERDLAKASKECNQLSQELSRLVKERIDAEVMRDQASDLLRKYQEGLPDFINEHEVGTHFKTFNEFLMHSNSVAPSQVTRLGMMLRVFADAMSREDSAFEIVWSAHEIGKILYAVMRAMNHDDSWQFEEASAWAQALNKSGAGKFSIFVPVVKSNFNGLEMTGGAPQSLIQEIKSWGVRNRRGDVERKAIVK